jgi:hypothetical protein
VIKKLLPFILLLSVNVLAEEDKAIELWNKYKGDLYKSCKAYVAEFSDDKQITKWNAKIAEQLETRTLETVALDWFADNRSDLENEVPSAIVQACFFFIRFVETNTLPPAHVRNNITEENLKALQRYLDDRVTIARKLMRKQ